MDRGDAFTAGRIVQPGQITEIVGPLSSGRTSLLLACLAAVTRQDRVAAIVDVDSAFDPVAAARAGVELSRLLWIRCGGRRHVALRAAGLLVRCPGFALVALDLGELVPRVPLTVGFRLRLTVRRTGAALVILGRRRVTGAGATLVLRTLQHGPEWTGPGGRPSRFARLATEVRVLRGVGPLTRGEPTGIGERFEWWNR